MQNNQISASIADADQASIISDLADISKRLAPVLIFNLTPLERKEMLKMGDKTLAFVQKSLEYAVANPTIVPTFLDVPEAQKDYNLTRSLYTIYQQLITIVRGIEDTMMVSGGEAYDGSLIFFAAVKAATKSNVAGSQAVYEDLQERFPRRVKSKEKSSGTTPADPAK